MNTSREAAAEARAAAVRQSTDRPSQRRSGSEPSSIAAVRVAFDCVEMRAKKSETSDLVVITAYASVTERGYDMWDTFGPYTEVVGREAFDATLSRSPMVEFTVNHGAGGGLPMAHTRNGSLVLSANDEGLLYEATVDPTRGDVRDMLKAIERGDLAESSFKFRIDSGKWSPDYSEYRIEQVDLDRGDVSAVNFGANPHTGEHGLVPSARAEEPAPVVDFRAALLAAYLEG